MDYWRTSKILRNDGFYTAIVKEEQAKSALSKQKQSKTRLARVSTMLLDRRTRIIACVIGAVCCLQNEKQLIAELPFLMERITGLEPATSTLARWRSTK